MNELIAQLAQSRLQAQSAKERLAELQAESHYVDAVKAKKSAENDVAALESLARSKGIRSHQAGEELHPALNTRKKVTFDYVPLAAIGWAIQKEFYNLLKLDAKGFEKLARALDEGGNAISFVQMDDTVQITIAGDLSEWLELPTDDLLVEHGDNALLAEASEALLGDS